MGFISAFLLTNLVALVRPIGLTVLLCVEWKYAKHNETRNKSNYFKQFWKLRISNYLFFT